MIRTLLAAAALSVVLAGSANACLLTGVCGNKGNDTGGIIPWSPENERMAFDYAQANCGFYNKYPVATSIHRVYGDFIAYKCVWDPPGRGHRYRYH